MLWAIAIILLVLWIFGLATHVLGSFIHILLLLAIATVLIRVIQGRRAV